MERLTEKVKTSVENFKKDPWMNSMNILLPILIVISVFIVLWWLFTMYEVYKKSQNNKKQDDKK